MSILRIALWWKRERPIRTIRELTSERIEEDAVDEQASVKDAIKASWTARAAAALGVVGAASWIEPELLELIPEQWRGPAITVVGLLVLAARLRKEIAAALGR